MDILEIDKLVLFLIFFIPGFISIKVYDLLVAGERRDFSSSIFEVIGYTTLNFAGLSWLIIFIHSGNFYNNHQVQYLFSLFLIIFIAPILWPLVWIKLSSWEYISKHIVHPIQKPWDYYFSNTEPCWAIVHLTDGECIGGLYHFNSFASSNPAEEQIYLEQVWELDEEGKFINAIDKTKGVIVLGKSIEMIEFFEIEKEQEVKKSQEIKKK